MGKTAIWVASAVALLLLLVGGIGSAVSHGDSTFVAMSYGGYGIGFLAWLFALRDSWWCKAYGWLAAIFFLYGGLPIVTLLYGLLGPGRMALMAEKRLSWLLNVGPSRADVPNLVPTTQWTVPQLKQSVNYWAGHDGYDLVDSDDVLIRTIRRFRWRVLEDGSVTR